MEPELAGVGTRAVRTSFTAGTEATLDGTGTATDDAPRCAITVPDTAFGATMPTSAPGRSTKYPASASASSATANNPTAHAQRYDLGARHGSCFA